jgi:hypothetical protein
MDKTPSSLRAASSEPTPTLQATANERLSCQRADRFAQKKMAEGLRHRSLGQRPRRAPDDPTHLAESHPHPFQRCVWPSAKALRRSLPFLGRCPRLRCEQAFGQKLGFAPKPEQEDTPVHYKVARPISTRDEKNAAAN